LSDVRGFLARVSARLAPTTAGTVFAVLRIVLQAAVDGSRRTRVRAEGDASRG
jgi:hypothetical protein